MTEKKLDVLDAYLDSYCKIMKNQDFKLLYIDAFAGSGKIRIKDGKVIEGSATRASRHPFDQYYFIDSGKNNILSLKESLKNNERFDKMMFINKDCNKAISDIIDNNMYRKRMRGVIFIDPFAMDFEWKSLEKVSESGIFDVWLFFPLMAPNRLLNKDRRQISENNRLRLNLVFGSNSWEDVLYSESDQISIFGDEYKKAGTERLRNYILGRLEEIFPYVSNNAVVLKNSKKSPQFLLCFAVSNKSRAAQVLADRVASHLLKGIGKDE